jgi:hypothetical protein
MMPEGGTSIQVSVRLAAGLLLYRLLCARSYRETLSEQETCARRVPQDVERALVKIARTASNRALLCHGQRVYQKGKRLGQSAPIWQFAAQVARKAGYAS